MNDKIRAYVNNLDKEYLPTPITSPEDISDEQTQGVILELVKVGEDYTAIPIKRRPLPEKVEVEDPRGWVQRFKDNLVMRFCSDDRKRNMLQGIDNERTFAQTEAQYEFLKAYSEVMGLDTGELKSSYIDLRDYRSSLRDAIDLASEIMQGTESEIERMITGIENLEHDLKSKECRQMVTQQIATDGYSKFEGALRQERDRRRKIIPQLVREREYLARKIEEVKEYGVICEESLISIHSALEKASIQQNDLRRTLHLYERVTLPQLRAARSVQNLEEAADIANSLKANMNRVDEMLTDAVTSYLEIPDGEIAPDLERALVQREVRKLTNGS